MTYYEEIILASDGYNNLKGEAEKIALDKWISKELDIVFKNNIIPFHKPINELLQEHKMTSWSDLIFTLNKSQETYLKFKNALPEKCPLCGASIEKERIYNFTKVAGCMQYEYRKCNYAHTFYLSEVFDRLEILEKSLSVFERNKILERIKIYGSNGLPDYIGLKNGVLYSIEVKDIKEKLFKMQHDWLNWFAKNTRAKAILIRIKSSNML